MSWAPCPTARAVLEFLSRQPGGRADVRAILAAVPRNRKTVYVALSRAVAAGAVLEIGGGLRSRLYRLADGGTPPQDARTEREPVTYGYPARTPSLRTPSHPNATSNAHPLDSYTHPIVTPSSPLHHHLNTPSAPPMGGVGGGSGTDSPCDSKNVDVDVDVRIQFLEERLRRLEETVRALSRPPQAAPLPAPTPPTPPQAPPATVARPEPERVTAPSWNEATTPEAAEILEHVAELLERSNRDFPGPVAFALDASSLERLRRWPLARVRAALANVLIREATHGPGTFAGRGARPATSPGAVFWAGASGRLDLSGAPEANKTMGDVLLAVERIKRERPRRAAPAPLDLDAERRKRDERAAKEREEIVTRVREAREAAERERAAQGEPPPSFEQLRAARRGKVTRF